MLRYMTAGESHGKSIMAILDGVPAGLEVDQKFIQTELERRKHGYGRGKRMAIEPDRPEIIAGTRNGLTIGSPVGIVIENKDYKINELPSVKCPRPGHADLAGMQKYGLKDARDVLERASARETAARTAVGAVAKLILREFDIKILSHVTALGKVKAKTDGLSFNEILEKSDWTKTDFRCADKAAEKLMRKEIDAARKAGDTLGGSFEVIASGIPVGLGSYAQWDRRLDGALARSVMSIPAIKAVSIGGGFECAEKKGSKVHDPIAYDASGRIFVRKSNNAGGLEGGITNGEPVTITGFMKPIATLLTPLKSVNVDTKEKSEAAVERADTSAVAAAGVVAEAVIALELASAFLEKFGGDSILEVRRNYETYLLHLKDL